MACRAVALARRSGPAQRRLGVGGIDVPDSAFRILLAVWNRLCLGRRLQTAAYRCSRVIHQSAGEEPRSGSLSSPRQIVNNSAAPAAALRRSRGKLPNGHAAPGHELQPLSFNDFKETFGPGASSRSSDEHSDDNPSRFSVSISHGSSGAPGENSLKLKSNSTQKETNQR